MEDSHSRTPPGAPLTTDRRLNRRHPVRPTEYLEVGDNNGGIILDISEAGMAIATAQALVGQQILRFRFQLPRLLDTIETFAEISWIGETKKRAGVRFIDLSPAAREKILNWIDLQTADRAVGPAAAFASPAIENTEELSHPNPATIWNTPSKSGSPSGFELPDEPEIDDRENSRPAYESQKGKDSQQQLVERRSQLRRSMSTNTYLQLNDGNGGLIANLSETGLSFRAAKILESDQFLVRFQLPASKHFIETPAWIVWKSPSGKKAGARFETLSDAARSQIADWIGSQVLPQNPPNQREQSASDAEFSRSIELLGADSVPIPAYISPLTRKPIAVPISSSALDFSAQPVTASVNTPFTAGAAPPLVLSSGKLSASVPAKHASPVASQAPEPVSPAAPNTGLPKADLPDALAAQGPRNAKSSVDKPFPRSSSAVIANPAMPPVYSESSWYMTPKKPNRFWKIAALLIFIGGASFGVKTFFYRDRRIPAPPSGRATQTSLAANAYPESKSPASAENSLYKSSSIPSATAPVAKNPIDVIAKAQGPTRNQQFVDQPRDEQSVVQPRTANAQRIQEAAPVIHIDQSGQTASPTERMPVRHDGANRASLAGSRVLDESTAVDLSNRQDTSVRLAPTEPSLTDSTSSHNQVPQSATTSAARPLQPAPTSPASDLSSVTMGSTPAVSSAAISAPAESLVGSVSFSSRFRAIRTPGDSSNNSANSRGILQIGPLLSSPLPAYPADAQRQQIQGPVELDVFVGSDGNVQAVHLAKGPAELATVAMGAVRAWHYGQTLLGGRPVDTEQSIYFTFKLKK